MKKTIKMILTSLAALAILSTTPIKLNAYNMNEPKIVVQSEKRDLHVNFNKDGKKFVYSRMKDVDFYRIESEIVINENGIEKIVTQGFADFKPAFSPDGKKIAFFRNLGFGHGYVCTVDVDGKNLEEIIPTVITKVSWSPDGKEIAFTAPGTEEKTDNTACKPGDEIRYKDHYYAVGLVDVKTKELKYLTKNDGNSGNPEFTDDGKILYLFNKDKTSSSSKELWIMDRDGNNKRPLVQLENYTQRIANEDGSVTLYMKEGTVDHVSSDGDLIAYSADTRERIVQIIPKKINKLDYDVKEIKDEYTGSVYVKNLKTGETKLVTDEETVWFPELKNNKLYFSRCESEETDHDIYSIDLK